MRARRVISVAVCVAVLLSILGVPFAAASESSVMSIDASKAQTCIRRGATGAVTDFGLTPTTVTTRLGIIGDFEFLSIFSDALVGFFYNPGPNAVEMGNAAIRYFNASGSVIRTDSFDIGVGGREGMFYVLEPGEIAPFRISPSVYGGPPPGTVGWELVASSVQCPKYSIWPEVNNTVAEAQANLSAHFAGTVTNDTPYVLDELIVSSVVVSKATGLIYEVAWQRITGPISPGASVAYEMWVGDRPDEAADMGYFVAAEGKKSPTTTPDFRISGQDRYKTALEASRYGFDDGSAPKVIIASGLSFADALCASPLAGAYDAPILLLKPDAVPWPIEFADELQRLGCTEAIIVGGTSVVSENAAAALKSMLPEGGVVRRLAGTDRYGTCAAVLSELKTATADAPPTEAFVVRGDVFADALASSPYAWSRHMPVALVRPSAVPAGVMSALKSFTPTKLWVVGSTTAVANQTATSIGVPWQRIAGSDRYSTAAWVVLTAESEGWSGLSTLGIVSGVGFPDALVAGPVLGGHDGGLLLTAPTSLPGATASGIYTISDRVTALQIYGGVPAVNTWTALQARFLCR